MQGIHINADAIPTSYSAQGPIIPYYNSTQSVNPSIAGLPLELGAWWDLHIAPYKEDVSFQVLKIDAVASTTYSAGVLLKLSPPATGTVVNAGSTTQAIIVTIASIVANAEVGNIIYFQDLGVMRVIKANTATASGNATFTVSLTTSLVGNNVADADALASVPANGSNVIIYRPYAVTLCDATHPPVGVLLNDTDVSLGPKVIAQFRGPALVLASNTGAALTANIPGITAASGVATGGTTYLPGVSLIPLIAYNSASNARLPFQINLSGV